MSMTASSSASSSSSSAPAQAQAASATVLDLYSVRDAARLFSVTESRLRYWIQTGFVRPSVRQGGRFYYTFADLVGLKAAVELLGAGVPLQRVRRALAGLRGALPERVAETSRLRVSSDGETLVVVDDGSTWEPESGQLVMTFALTSLAGQIAERLPAPEPERDPAVESEWVEGARAATETEGDAAATAAAEGESAIGAEVGAATAGAEEAQPAPSPATRSQRVSSGYQAFLDGCRAEDRGDLELAESCYRRALAIEPSQAAAHTNLGNLCLRRGDRLAAQDAYQRALELEPEQAEARFNLANLLDEAGETELAVAELRAVCTRHPGFADAHYNLGLLLVRLGGLSQAQQHLEHYLTLDASSEWAAHARALLDQVG